MSLRPTPGSLRPTPVSLRPTPMSVRQTPVRRRALAACLLLAALPLAGCGASIAGDDDTTHEVSSYQLEFHTDPAAPVVDQSAELWYTIEDQDGLPIQDLQQNHDRLVHVFLISRDLSSFEHKHHEDYYPITVDDLQTATYHFPESFPYSGDFLAAFDFAHNNQYHMLTQLVTVAGDVPQAATPSVEISLESSVPGVHATLQWDVEPVAGYEGQWTVVLADEADQPITDVVQWLGADAHVGMVKSDLSWVNHTHAWYPGMENVPPDHQMDHVYDGPTIPFHFTFETGGTYKMWIQFARAANPDQPFTLPFAFRVQQ